VERHQQPNVGPPYPHQGRHCLACGVVAVNNGDVASVTYSRQCSQGAVVEDGPPTQGVYGSKLDFRFFWRAPEFANAAQITRNTVRAQLFGQRRNRSAPPALRKRQGQVQDVHCNGLTADIRTRR
jgi:hypothetical protein